MATKKAPEKTEDLDDILGSIPIKKPEVRFSPKEVARQTAAKASTGEVKQKQVRAPRTAKGVLVAFRTKDKRELIVAPGVIYYVVRMHGKLHYKEGTQVVILPDDWSEGDGIPWDTIGGDPSTGAEDQLEKELNTDTEIVEVGSDEEDLSA